MGIIQAFILSVIQGITEFIPVSSSGHLVLFQSFLNVDIVEDDIIFEVLVHAGTSLSIFIVFYRDIEKIILDCFNSDKEKRYDAWRYVGYIGVGSIPVVLVAIFFMKPIVSSFASPTLAASLLLITGLILYSTRANTGEGKSVTLKSALLIGLAQAFSPLPGISRSGVTIAVALMIGISRKEAGRFSFMLALPALTGACLNDLLKKGSLETLALSPSAIIVSFAVSAVTGYIALRILLSFVQSGKIHYFAYYCVPASLIFLGLLKIMKG